jgi:hypothetical protein
MTIGELFQERQNIDHAPSCASKRLLSEIERHSEQRLPFQTYVREAWHIAEPATKYVHGWHIDAIAEHLQAVNRGEIRNLLINIPPRHSKSLLVSVFWPTWVWSWNPSVRWLFASYAQSLSTRDSVKSRRLIESPWYQTQWGHRFRLTYDQNQKVRFDNDRTGYRLATSVGGSATGEGGDVIVADDPHNVKDGESEAERESVLVSLSVTSGSDGRVLIHCHAGCETPRVLETIGLRLSDLFPGTSRFHPDPDATQHRRALQGLQHWADRKLTETCRMLRDLESLISATSSLLLLFETGAPVCTQEALNRTWDFLCLAYRWRDELEMEFEILKGDNLAAKLALWRQLENRP